VLGVAPPARRGREGPCGFFADRCSRHRGGRGLDVRMISGPPPKLQYRCTNCRYPWALARCGPSGPLRVRIGRRSSAKRLLRGASAHLPRDLPGSKPSTARTRRGASACYATTVIGEILRADDLSRRRAVIEREQEGQPLANRRRCRSSSASSILRSGGSARSGRRRSPRSPDRATFATAHRRREQRARPRVHRAARRTPGIVRRRRARPPPPA
jgi:hypothetical protein